MEVVLVEPGKEARLAEIGSDLRSLQAAVGGYIEALQLNKKQLEKLNKLRELAGTPVIAQ